MRLIMTNSKIYKNVKKGEPYIVGSCTNFRLHKMKKVIEFLLRMDPNRHNVLDRCLNDEKKIQLYYRA
jgi:homoaconitase/3-isopropylmalate dehydratase large subunit